MNLMAEMQIQDPVLGEIVRRLVDDCQPVRIYLFGSRARGNAGADSSRGRQEANRVAPRARPSLASHPMPSLIFVSRFSAASVATACWAV
jgi:hypothetical protein